MEYMGLIILAVAVVIALSTVSDRLGVAPPLILMVVGVGVSLLPFVASIRIDPEWILAGVLPPLLYAAAVAIPTTDLRRDFLPVGALAVVLVVISAVAVGFVVHWLVPGIGLAPGIALGAILSPTDAVATRIVRRLGVPNRVGTILEGESLLNDATALVLLRSAIAATAVSVPIIQWVGQFLWAAAAAAVIGAVVGWAGVRVRALVREPAPATAISFLLPFAVYFLAELVHASGLVAVVAAGVAAAELGPVHLDARQRVSERANWHTVEFLLEGAVFLVMGLELSALLTDLYRTHETLGLAIGVAALALGLMLVVRWVYVDLLVRSTRARTRFRHARTTRWRDPAHRSRQALASGRAAVTVRLDQAKPRTRARAERWMDRVGAWLRRYVADVDYLIHQPLGMREGTLLTWAGMRGVVTVAAAQTLPLATPHRSLLVFTAFLVAAVSLLLQGGTLSAVIRLLKLDGQDEAPPDEWPRLQAELAAATPPHPVAAGDLARLAVVRARRQVLLGLRSTGRYTCRNLAIALAELDADEMALQLRLAGPGFRWATPASPVPPAPASGDTAERPTTPR